MSDEVQAKSKELRRSVTFREELITQLPIGCKFYHPLPRDSRSPVIPFSIDNTPLNGWDTQSRNGYFMRTILLTYLTGRQTET